MDPDNLLEHEASAMSFGEGSAKAKAWRDIWGAGQGIGAVRDLVPAGALVDRLEHEYRAACARTARLVAGIEG
jgi:nitronate monooxygenase